MLENIQNLLSRNRDIINLSTEEQEKWLVEVGQQSLFLDDLQDFTLMTQAQVLYTVWSIWEPNNNDEEIFIATAAKSKWDWDFYRWAKNYTKRRGKEPAEETINNKISVYRDFVVEQNIEYPQYVYLPKQDIYGNEQKELVEKVEFDPMRSDYSKLLICRGTARKGGMTPEGWAAVMNPYSTASDLQDIIKKKEPSNPDDFYIAEEDGIIYGCENGRRIAVLQAVFENSYDELYVKTLKHILRAVGLKVRSL